jgi:broad specificity phosphatase PhoE
MLRNSIASLIIGASLFVWLTPALAKDYHIYLVRHAEKQTGQDPQLTLCGQERAEQLAIILASIELEKIYSTKTRRTLATATPTAQQKGLPIVSYQGKNLDELVMQLHQNKQSALVVGHSNTTPVVAGKLIDKTLSVLDESEYSQLYQVSLDSEQPITQGKMTIFHQPLSCGK